MLLRLLLREEEDADDKLLSADIDSYKRTTKWKMRRLLQLYKHFVSKLDATVLFLKKSVKKTEIEEC
jgi:hypothetical protein